MDVPAGKIVQTSIKTVYIALSGKRRTIRFHRLYRVTHVSIMQLMATSAVRWYPLTEPTVQPDTGIRHRAPQIRVRLGERGNLSISYNRGPINRTATTESRADRHTFLIAHDMKEEAGAERDLFLRENHQPKHLREAYPSPARQATSATAPERKLALRGGGKGSGGARGKL